MEVAQLFKIVMNAGEWIWKKYLMKSELGLLPKEYNKKIHGVYCPWRYYGKKDINFFDVKLGDLPAWYARRDKSFKAFRAAIGRGLNGAFSNATCKIAFNDFQVTTNGCTTGFRHVV
ncbi:WRW domain containing protein [Trichuris trichiura]|uniref:WRW domain containing protein n=1 Tax=Trichuris trichiura TaxID=36087 RepID=A0A077Z1C0_TRITR|nr:WRW domain containing protein [Trichuris trichiura]